MKFAIVKEICNRYEFTKIHENIEEAKAEAERLCRKERATFYVLELKFKCYLEDIPVTWKKL